MAGLLGRLFRRRREELRCAAVVPAAGSPTRMGQDKLLPPLGEQPVLLHTLRALELCPYITEIVVVTREELIVPIGQLCRDAALEKVRKVIVGGAPRRHRRDPDGRGQRAYFICQKRRGAACHGEYDEDNDLYCWSGKRLYV